MIARVKIDVGGTSITHFDNLSISQPFDDHHTMSIRVSTADLNEALGMNGTSSTVNLGQLTQDWANKKITVTIKQGETDQAGTLSEKNRQIFVGWVTRISIQMQDSINNSVLINAMSSTFWFDSQENTMPHFDMKLSEIIKMVLPLLSSDVNPINDPTIPYVVCYRETYFHFIQRLAKKYGEWFFYDGTKMIFGKPAVQTSQPITLEFGSNLTEMSFETKLVDFTAKSKIYDYEKDQFYTNSTTYKDIEAKNVAEKSLLASQEIYDNYWIDLSHQHYTDNESLTNSMKNKSRMAANQLAILKGSAKTLGLAPGRLIAVNDEVKVNGVTIRTDQYGEFLITKVAHYVDANGSYQNTFEAIPDDPDHPPTTYPKVKQPIAESQHAVIKDTNDDMGRVKIHFPWFAQENYTTPWIRVANAMSGKDVGVYFVPEVGEKVFVDFDFGDPDMPFVRGSFYDGKHKPGSKLFEQKNNFKGIITKGGNHILIDDTNGKENIKIYNKDSKNELVLTLDGGEQILIKSKGKIKLDADEIEMNAKNIKITASQDLKVKTSNTDIKADQSIKVKANSDMALEAGTDLKAKGTNVSLEATADLKVKGINVGIKGDMMAAVESSTIAKIDGGATTVVKGALVMIN